MHSLAVFSQMVVLISRMLLFRAHNILKATKKEGLGQKVSLICWYDFAFVFATHTVVMCLLCSNAKKEGLNFSFVLCTFPPSRKTLKLRMQKRLTS